MFEDLHDPVLVDKYRYLINYEGAWRRLDTYAKDPDWSEGVTDVIALASADRRYNTWRKKNNRRYLLRRPPIVKDKELLLIMLQVESC
jgi:hypothetical protein